jgi:hypothetical protein
MLIAHITAPIAHSPICAGFMLAYHQGGRVVSAKTATASHPFQSARPALCTNPT